MTREQNAHKKFAALAVMTGLCAEGRSRRKAALLRGAPLLADDCRIRCPGLARPLLAVFPGADVDGDNSWLQLCW